MGASPHHAEHQSDDAYHHHSAASASPKIAPPEPTTDLERQVFALPDNDCRRAIRKVWPQELWVQAITVAHKENGKGNPRATLYNTNHTTDMGCFQVNTIHFRNGKWRGQWEGRNAAFDPETNARIALDIYRGNGSRWNPWCAVYKIYWTGRGCGHP